MLSFVLWTLSFVGASDAQSIPGAQAPPAAVELQVHGRVIEEGTQAPVAGAQVMLMPIPQGPPPTATPSMTRPPSTTTDAEGRFRFSGVAAGSYRVSAQKPGFAVPMETMLRLPEVTVTAGAPATPVELIVQRGAVISGRVVDAAGEPVVNARVMAMRRRPEPPANAPAAVREAMARSTNRLVGAGAPATTDDRGEYRLHSLPTGEYFLQAMPMPGFGGGASAPAAAETAFIPTFHPSATSQDEAQAVTVAAGQAIDGLTIRMATAAVFQVSGSIVDASGAPVPEAMVRVMPADPADGLLMMAMPGTTRTDARGEFVLPQVRGGHYSLIAVAPVVIAREASPSSGGSSMVSGSTGGLPGAMVTTETRNGVTVRFRDEDGTKLPLTVDGQHVRGLRVVVKRPAPPQ